MCGYELHGQYTKKTPHMYYICITHVIHMLLTCLDLPYHCDANTTLLGSNHCFPPIVTYRNKRNTVAIVNMLGNFSKPVVPKT